MKLNKENEMVYVFDINYYDDSDIKTELDTIVEECIMKYDSMREAVADLLSNFFEARSDYGDPVSDILKYVPDQNLGNILTDYNYLFDESKSGLISKIKLEGGY